ncbi:helix-turn-helix transcriptional regulator [Thiotrichales bacterium 19X7-9]|nr:helix-turn-helix transcriptional regulator [Thiotrichales bacterium 19X7-9]
MIIDENIMISFCRKLNIPLIILDKKMHPILESVAFSKLCQSINININELTNSNNLNHKYSKNGQTIKVKWQLYQSANENTLITGKIINDGSSEIITSNGSDKILNEYLSNMPFSLFIKSENGIYLESNQVNINDLGVNVIGKDDYEIFNESFASDIIKNDYQTFRNKLYYGLETIHTGQYLCIKTIAQHNHDNVLIGTAFKFEKFNQTLFNQFLKNIIPDSDFQSLTPKEAQCIELSSNGKTNKEIAYILSISQKTVDFHINNAKVKLNTYKKNKLMYLFGKFHQSLL